jgi:YggT family protein
VNIISIVYSAFEILSWLIVARVILSWVRHDPGNPIIRFVYEVTEPVLRPFRRLMPGRSPVDFSPILAFLAIYLIRQVVIYILQMVL